jgi:hypothetical protein
MRDVQPYKEDIYIVLTTPISMPEPHSRLPAADLTHGTSGSDIDLPDSIAGKDNLIGRKCCGTLAGF